MVDTIYPILYAFDGHALARKIGVDIDKKWNLLMENADFNGLYHLMEVFWFIKDTDTLLFIKEAISTTEEVEVDPEKIDDEKDSEVLRLSIISVLSKFQLEYDKNRISIELLLEYATKNTKDIPYVLNVLIDQFGYKHDSYKHQWRTQSNVINILIEQSNNGENQLITNILLAIFKHYLMIEFENTESDGRHSFHMIRFVLPANSNIIKEHRKTMWNEMFKLFNKVPYQTKVLNVFMSYVKLAFQNEAKEILNFDYDTIYPLLISEFNSDSFIVVSLVNEYLTNLKLLDISYDKSLHYVFTNELFQLSNLILLDRLDKLNLQLLYYEYE